MSHSAHCADGFMDLFLFKDLQLLVLESLDIIDVPSNKYSLLSQKYVNSQNWARLSYKEPLSEEFMEHFEKKLHWPLICQHQFLNEGFIHKFKNRMSWQQISSFQHLSLEFIMTFAPKLSEITLPEEQGWENYDEDEYEDMWG